MPRQNTSPADYPQAVLQQIEQLAQNIAIARKRRGETQGQWAKKLGVSQPTMARIERGDPSVAMASYVMCMWLINQAHGLADLVAPLQDHAALEREVLRVRKQKPQGPKPGARRTDANAEAMDPAAGAARKHLPAPAAAWQTGAAAAPPGAGKASQSPATDSMAALARAFGDQRKFANAPKAAEQERSFGVPQKAAAAAAQAGIFGDKRKFASIPQAADPERTLDLKGRANATAQGLAALLLTKQPHKKP